jgi:hypothetical protein
MIVYDFLMSNANISRHASLSLVNVLSCASRVICITAALLTAILSSACDEPARPGHAAPPEEIETSKLMIWDSAKVGNRIYNNGGLVLAQTHTPGEYNAVEQKSAATVYVFRSLEQLSPDYITNHRQVFSYLQASDDLEAFQPDYLQQHQIKAGGAYVVRSGNLQYFRDVDLGLSNDKIVQLFFKLSDSDFAKAFSRLPK